MKEGDDDARKPQAKKRPRTVRIAEITNDSVIPNNQDNGYITSDDEEPPLEDGINRVSWDHFLRLPEEKKSDKPPDEETTKKKRKMTWDRGFRALKKYKKKHGNTCVPKGYAGGNPAFEIWIDQLRNKFHRKSKGEPTKLSDERYVALQKLGFQVSEPKMKKATFEKRMTQLKKFKREFHHVKVPRGFAAIKGLRAWVIKTRNQLREKEKGNPSTLTDEQIQALNELGFFWNKKRGKMDRKTKTRKNGNSTRGEADAEANSDQPSTPDFAQRLKDVQAFKTVFKSTYVPEGYEVVPGLREWTMKIRQQYWEIVGGCPSGLSEGQIYLLNEVGFEWDEEEPTKQEARQGSNHSREQQGGQKVVASLKKPSPPLALRQTHSQGEEPFVGEQSEPARTQGGKESFAQRVSRLKALQRGHSPVTFNSTDLSEHPHQSGSSRPKASETTAEKGVTPKIKVEAGTGDSGNQNKDDNKQMGNMKIPKKRSSKTVCKIHINSWLARMKRLEQYKATHGNINIPAEYPADQHFADWVHEQQRDFARRWNGDFAALSAERFEALQKIGFEAPLVKAAPPSFYERVAQLKHFFELHGHVKVPKKYADAPGLRKWLSTMRAQFKVLEQGGDSTLSFGEIEVLNLLDFHWRGKKAKLAAKENDNSLRNGSINSPTKAPADSAVLKAQKGPPKRCDNCEGQMDLKIKGFAAASSQDAPNMREQPNGKEYDSGRNGSAAASKPVLTKYAANSWEGQNGKGGDSRKHNSASGPPGTTTYARKSWEDPNGKWDDSKKYGAARYPPASRFANTNNVTNSWKITKGKRDDSKRYGSAIRHVPTNYARKNWEEPNGKGGDSKRYGSASGPPATRHPPTSYSRLDSSLGVQAADISAIKQEPGLSTSHITQDSSRGVQAAGSAAIKQEPTSYTSQDTSWGGRLKQLEEYKALHGNIDVPQVFEPDQAFANWVRTQRRLFSKRVGGLTDALADERFNLLKNIGFGSSSSKPAAKGSSAFASETNTVRADNGDDRKADSRTKDSTVFGSKRGEAPKHLNKQDSLWESRLQQLKEYKSLNGNTRVPHIFEADQAFANWVKTQRRLFSSRIRGLTDAISDHRFFALQKLNFEASVPR